MILKGIVVCLAGLLFVWLGVVGWIGRRRERISIIEAAILKAGNADPLPFNGWDRAMAYVQPILMLLFGPAMIFLGLVLIFV